MVPIPSKDSLYNDILADLQAAYGITAAFFGKVFLRALAMTQAGKLYLYYLALADVQKNIAPDTAYTELQGGTLERWGRIKLNRNPFPALAGQYTVTITGSTGATIPAETTFKSNDNATNPGYLFVLDTAYTMPGTTGTITIRSLTPGVEAQLQVTGTPDTLTATAPILGVDSLVTVATEVIQPLAAETTEAYRAKVLDAFRLEAQGGAGTDYRLWAADAQGVQRVYPYARTGFANELIIYVEATVADSTDGRGTPSGAMLTAVEAVIEFDPDATRPLTERGRRPLGIFDITYSPIVPVPVDLNIAGYQGLDTATQTAITNALTDLINSVRPFVASADIIANKNDVLDTNRIIATILSVRPGSTFGAITLTIGGTPTLSNTFIAGNIPYVNSISFS